MTGTARTLKPFLTRQWRALAGAGGATTTLTAADLAKPWPVAIVVDELFAGREGGFDLTASDTRLLVIIAALVVTIAAVDALSTYLADMWLQRAGERINHELRVALYAHLQRLSLGYHQRRPKGDLVTRVTGDVNAVGALFADSLGPMLQSALLLIGVLAVSIFLDPLLALVAFAATPLIAIVSVRYRRKLREAARRQRRQEGEIATIANEALSAMPVVKAFGSERYEHDRVESRSAVRMDLGVEVARLQARFEGLIGVLSAAGVAVVIVVGVLRVAAGVLSPGDLIVFASYGRKINSPLRAIAKQAAKVSRAMARADRIAEVLAEDEVLEDRPGAYAGGRAEGRLELEGVSFAYDPARPVLRDVSLSIRPGSCVALIGPSGSGKSTLAALVARFHDPVSGTVRIDGRDARDCSLQWLREQIGVVLQETVLFTGSVGENIAYATEANRDEVVEAARVAAAHDFVEELPDGYDTTLGPQGGGLSGGQRQRIGIARTLLRDPPVLVLDEPTSGLDSESRERVMDGLFALMRGRTTILITHSLELARRADRVVMLEAGRIARSGRPEELLAEPEVRSQVAEGRRRRPGSPPAPRDDALPQLGRMLDTEGMAAALAASLKRPAAVEVVGVERVSYRPGRRLVVHYRVNVDGELHDAVATAHTRIDLRESARERASELATYDEEIGALLTWLPVDPALPALTEPPRELCLRLRRAGIRVGGGESEPRVVGYKPWARAVLRVDGHVLKAYGKDRQYEAAVMGLHAVTGAGEVPAPRFEGVLPDLRVTVQSAVRGAPPAHAAEAAETAGRLARLLRESVPAGELTPAPPEHQLSEVRRSAERVRALLPHEEGRVERLLSRLERGLPRHTRLAAAHGDFHVDQLLRDDDGRLRLVDFDEMCAAPAALDLAMYAADVVRGRPGDSGAVSAVVASLLEGYGEQPAHFDWYLASAVLCRCTHPFRVLADDWPDRIGGNLAVAEEVLVS